MPDEERTGLFHQPSSSTAERRWLTTYAASDSCVLPSSVPMYSSHGHASAVGSPVTLAVRAHEADVDRSLKESRR